MKLKPSRAERFWIGLFVYVSVADLILWRTDCDMMSEAFRYWCATPRGKALTIGITGYLLGHLFMGWPLLPKTRVNDNGET